jgi:hypothetical protein
MKDKPFIKYIDVGPYPIWLGFTNDEKAYHKELDRMHLKDHPDFILSGSNATTHTFREVKKNDWLIIITIDPGKRELDQLFGLLIHEAAHAFFRILERIDERHSGEEIEAYTIQHIAQSMIREVIRQKGIKD